MTILLVEAKDHGSILRHQQLKATVELSHFLMNNFSITMGESNRKIRYNELCSPYCNVNIPLELFWVHLHDKL